MGRRGRRPHPDILTPREWEVLDLLRERLTNEQIAERLGITLDGAKYHVSEILSKLGVATREEAASWRPVERRAWWQRLIAPPVLARIAGGLTIGAAVCALVALAIGVIVTNGGSAPRIDPPVTRLSATSPADDCPPGASCPLTSPWETTSEYRDEHSDVALSVLSFEIDLERMTVTYALTNGNSTRAVRPSDIRMMDDLGNEYEVTHNTVLGPALGVVAGIATAERPPDVGETLTLVIDGVSIDDGVDSAPINDRWRVSFIKNVRPAAAPTYSLGASVAPESFTSHGTEIVTVPTEIVILPLVPARFVRVLRGGQEDFLSLSFLEGMPVPGSRPPPGPRR